MNRRTFPLAVRVHLLSSVVCAGEGEWSRFRGRDGAGLSDAATVPVTWTDKDLWCPSLGPYVGKHGSGVSPIIYQDLAILAKTTPNFMLYSRLYAILNPEPSLIAAARPR